jgi:hypothetical protein
VKAFPYVFFFCQVKGTAGNDMIDVPSRETMVVPVHSFGEL